MPPRLPPSLNQFQTYKVQIRKYVTWDKYARLPETDQRRQLQLKEVEPRLKTRLGWRHTTSERMSKFNDLSRDTTSPHLPPWNKAENLKIERVTLDKPKNEYTEEELLVPWRSTPWSEK